MYQGVVQQRRNWSGKPGSNRRGCAPRTRRPPSTLARLLIFSRIECFLAGKNWSGKPGSNRRPQPWQGCALPTELFPHSVRLTTAVVAEPARLRAPHQPWQGCALPTELFPHSVRLTTAVVAEPARLRAPHQPWQGCALPTELFPLGGYTLDKRDHCKLRLMRVKKKCENPVTSD